MSEVINPPDYYFTGINFNPAFYATDSGGLSVETANALYLRKTVADTATAIETFNLGIKAQKVDGLLSSSLMYVGNNITSGSLFLGNTGIRTKNQGVFETTSIRTPATNGQLTICTDLIAGGSVDVGTSASITNLYGTSKTNTLDALGGATATMNLASSITSGTINLMTNTLVSGTFNLMYNAVSNAIGTINIGQYNTSPSTTFTTTNIRGDVNIGTVGGATITTINRPLTVGYVPSAITNNTQIGYTVEDTINITTLTSGNQFAFTTGVTLPAGVWLITASFRITGPSVVVTDQNYGINIVGTVPTITYGQYLLTGSITASGLSYTGTGVVVSNGTTAYNVQLYIVYSGGSLAVSPSSNSSGSNIRRTRIA